MIRLLVGKHAPKVVSSGRRRRRSSSEVLAAADASCRPGLVLDVAESWDSARSSGVRAAGVAAAPSRRSCSRAATSWIARSASAPRSATTAVRMSPVRCDGPGPDASPSHHRVGPMLPALSNKLVPGSTPSSHSRRLPAHGGRVERREEGTATGATGASRSSSRRRGRPSRPCRSTSWNGEGCAIACRTVVFVPPVHHWTSSTVAGPKRAR